MAYLSSKIFTIVGAIPSLRRKLRSVSQRLKFSKKSILITAPSGKIPIELKDEAVILEFLLPQNEELETVLQRLTQQVLQLFTIACESPEKYGRPISHWTSTELAAEMKQQKESIGQTRTEIVV